MSGRGERQQVLIDHFGVPTWGMDAEAPVERYASVAGVDEFSHAHLATFDDLDEAFSWLADMVLEGLAPDGVYDPRSPSRSAC